MEKIGILKINTYILKEKINLKKLSLVGDHQYQNVGCAIMACNQNKYT